MSHESRAALVRKAAADEGVELPIEAVALLAESSYSSASFRALVRFIAKKAAGGGDLLAATRAAIEMQ